MMLHGLPIYTDLSMVERKPFPRSPARAKRRAAMGHPQHHRVVPRMEFIVTARMLIGHPEAVALLKKAIRARGEEARDG